MKSCAGRAVDVADIPRRSIASDVAAAPRISGNGRARHVKSGRPNMRQQNVVQSRGFGLRAINSAVVLGHRVKRGLVRSVAIAMMLAIYAAASIGSIASSALGVAGFSGLALTATATPANAWRRRRRRRRRWHRGYYHNDWGWRRRRRWRRRRHRGFSIHLHF